MNYHQKKFSRRELIKLIVCGFTVPFIGSLANKAEAAKTSKALGRIDIYGFPIPIIFGLLKEV